MPFMNNIYLLPNLCEYRRKPVENILGWGSTPSGTLRFKKIDGSFWNGETFRFADYINGLLLVREFGFS